MRGLPYNTHPTVSLEPLRGEISVSRQYLGALIVTVVVLVGLVASLFVLPMMQPPRATAESELNIAAERGARRLATVGRVADEAVAADRATVGLPETLVRPDAEAIQRAIAGNPNLISGPAGEIASRFRAILGDTDQAYQDLAGDLPSRGDAADVIDVPAGEGAQVGWIQKIMARGQDPATELLARLDRAISDLRQSLTSVSMTAYSGTDHFRGNYVLAGLQYQKALLLANLAANRRARADQICGELQDTYAWYVKAASLASAIETRLDAVQFAMPASTGQAAIEPATSEQPMADAAGEQAGQDNLLGRVTSLLQSAGAATAQEGAGDEQAAEITATEPAGQSALAGLPATEDPSVLAGAYVEQIDQQIEQMRRQIADLSEQLAGPRQELEQVSQQVEQLSQQLGQIDQAGYDVTDPESFQQYKQRYSEVATQLRQAEARAQALAEGTMAGAEVDPETADDLTQAKYTGGTPELGVITLQTRLEGMEKTLSLLEQARDQMVQMRQDLQQRKSQTEQVLSEADIRAQDLAGQMAAVNERLQGMLEQAAAFEQRAVDAARSAVQSYNSATQAARRQQQDARSALSAAAPTPEKPNVRLEMLSGYDTPQSAAMHGQINAYLLIAQINFEKAVSLQGCRNVLQAAEAAGIDTNLAAVDTAIQEALGAAIAAADDPNTQSDAAFYAEQYSRLINRERYAWLGPATQGLVYNMVAQAYEANAQPEQAARARGQAIEALSTATRGNENTELLQSYSYLLTSLRNSEGAASSPEPADTIMQ